MKPTEPIYLHPGSPENGDRLGWAVDSSGHLIYSHVSSSRGWAVSDLSRGVRRVYGLDLPEDDAELHALVQEGTRLIVTDDTHPVDPCQGCNQCSEPPEEMP